MNVSRSARVFISYSHDSEQHKDWVRRLAERLRRNGVDVVLDQWEIGPGDDVTAFMERELSSCDRVLIICTDEYIGKANTLRGGVGYERMIITAEIARNLKTRKFIPVLRNAQVRVLPKFLGARVYVDFRSGEIESKQYEILLRELLRAPKHTKPPLGRSPYSGETETPPGRGRETVTGDRDTILAKTVRIPGERNTGKTQEWKYHWHRSVHEYCGYKLYLILLRFTKGSILFKDSVLEDLRSAKISDYMIFHLYSDWDLLVRAWADENTIEDLRERFQRNRDLHRDRLPELLLVREIAHFPGDSSYLDAVDLRSALNKINLAQLRDVQDKGEESEHFGPLKEAGLILDQSVGFHPERIQFYITIRSIKGLEQERISSLKELIGNLTTIRNSSLYITSGSSIGAVVKGQAAQYYDIHDFLQAITKHLATEEIVTQTMFVASRNVRMSTRIDFDKAEQHILDKKMKDDVPELFISGGVRMEERFKLMAKYAETREARREDPEGILVGLIRAKANGSVNEIARLLTFFPPFEQKLRQKLVPVVTRVYRDDDWRTTIDGLKSKEGTGGKKVEDLLFGDLCKLYKRIVLEKRIMEISPLTDDEFRRVMDDAPNIRNKFAHERPDLTRWDELFSFCSAFIPIYSRLMAFIERI